MRRISRMAAAALAVAASVSSAAQVLTPPLSASPAVRLTDLCSTVNNAGVEVETAQATQIANAVNNPGGDPAELRSLWWPKSASVSNINGDTWVTLAYADPFQDAAQIASDIRARVLGVNNAQPNLFFCLDPSPPPPVLLVAEFQNPSNGEYRLAVGTAEISSLGADGWTQTADAYHVLGAGACYDGNPVFRFQHAQDGSRGGLFLTMDPGECGSFRTSDNGWRPLDIAFYSVPANGACPAGSQWSLPVYRLDLAQPAGVGGHAMHRYTSNNLTYDAMLSQGWTGRGLAFCAKP